MARKTIKTTKKEISEYWFENSNICETELNFDWADAEFSCWNCGAYRGSLHRAHIIPHALGGEDQPSNFVLLCSSCHAEAPDIANPKYMWEWIKHNRTASGVVGSYQTEKLLRLFEERRGYPFMSIMDQPGFSIELFQKDLETSLDTVGTHGFNVSLESTYAMFCEIYDKYKAKK